MQLALSVPLSFMPVFLAMSSQQDHSQFYNSQFFSVFVLQEYSTTILPITKKLRRTRKKEGQLGVKKQMQRHPKKSKIGKR
jgi:hypothetical protein